MAAPPPPGGIAESGTGAAPYVTLDEVRPFLEYSAGDTSDDPLLQIYIDEACDYVERRAGPIAATGFTERHDGWGGDTIELNAHPVLSVTYVNEYRSTGGLIVLAESTPANAVDGYQLEYPTGRLLRVFAGGWPRTFFPGSRNIEVSYTAGYDPVPPLIRGATLELIAHLWQQGHQRSAFSGGSIAGEGAEDAVETAPGAWSAVPYRIRDKIDLFREPIAY